MTISIVCLEGNDLSARLGDKISWIAEHVELPGGLAMGRKVGGFWSS